MRQLCGWLALSVGLARMLLGLALPVAPCPPGDAAAQDCAEERVAALMSWAENSDLYAPRLQTGQVNGMRGLLASKQIKKGGLLMSIPRAMALAVHEGAPCPFPMFMGDAEWNTFPEDVQLAALLLYHAKLGLHSDWYPYIQALPTHFDTLGHWTPPQLAELQLGSTTTELDFLSQVEQSREVLQQLHETYRRSKFSQRFNVTLEDRLWAVDCVHSRSVEVPKPFNWLQPALTSTAMLIAAGIFGLSPVRKRPRSKTMLNLTLLALVLTAGPVVYSIILYGASQPGGQTGTALLPLFDILNHDVKQEGTWLSSSWTGNSFRITAATEGFEPGQEATISYGKKPNEAFLLHYGFVDTSYKSDFYSADLLEYVVQQENVPAARVDALAADHKLHTAIESVSLKKGGAGREVIRALRFLLATPDEVQEAEEAGRSTGQWLADILEYRQLPTAMTPFNYITLSNATEMRVQQVLHHFCSFVLKSKPTSVKADEAELSELSKHQLMSQNEARQLLAIQFRYGKKKILQSCIRKHQKLATLLSGG